MATNDTHEVEAAGCENGVCVPKSAQQSSGVSRTTASFEEKLETENVNNDPSSPVTRVHIDIISDTMCPWCWVGKRNLEEGLRQSPGVQAEVNWLPYFLNERLPEEGLLMEDYFASQYGDRTLGDRMFPRLNAAGAKSGIKFNKVEKAFPTIRSHRLIEYAKEHDKEDEMVEALFEMYFQNGKHLNSVDHLVETARKVLGDNAISEVREFLEGKEKEDHVLEQARNYKVYTSGVPTFLFRRSDMPDSRPLALSGGQPPSSFVKVFNYLKELPVDEK